MSHDQMIQMVGEVAESLPNRMYRVLLDNDERVLATVAGRARRGLRIMVGDRVQIELSPYDLGRGRIIGAADQSTSG